MTREQIEKAAQEAVQDLFQCNGKYPCEERNYCEFCNGHNSAFDCKEDCGADDFNEGFIAGAQWRVNSVWHDVSEKPEANRHYLVLYRFEGEMLTKVEVDLFTISQEIWDLSISRKRVMSWAYIDDLLPERKEEAE